MGFYVAWAIWGIILLLAAALVRGESTNGSNYGILIDSRGRYSLTRLQIVVWTILVFSTMFGLLFADPGRLDVKAFAIPAELLILVGISAGSTTLSGAVKSAKDAPGSSAVVARAGVTIGSRTITPHWGQIIQEEEGALADQIISVTKFQNLILTLGLGLVYVFLVAQTKGYPTFDEKVLWLFGISHAGYVGEKIPNKS